MSIHSLPVALEPLFRTTKLNEPIIIYEGNLTIHSEDSLSLSYSGTVQWNWLPSPGLIVAAEFQMDHGQQLCAAHKAFFSTNTRIEVPGMAAIRMLPTHFDLGGNITGKLQGMYYPQDSQDLTELVFHIPNFPNYHGNVIKNGAEGARSGRIVLDADVWSVIIDNLDSTDTLTNSLKEEGGYAITHVGVLKRHDAAPFKLADAEALMECLGFFLSFISGRWSPPILWVGKQFPCLKTVLIVPANLRLNSWKSTDSWCNINGIKVADDIRALFPIFLNRFTNEHELFRLSVWV